MGDNMKGKLYYLYGAMSSLKSGQLLCKQHQFEQCGCHTILLKPSFDTRDTGVIKSRAMKDEKECTTFSDVDDLTIVIGNLLKDERNNVVFVDEVSFMNPKQIKQLWQASRDYGISIFCYGLKTNYKNELFEASRELFIYADKVEEIKSMCSYCNNKATTHLRFIGDKPVFDGDSCIVGDVAGEEHYKSVCQECWHKHLSNSKTSNYIAEVRLKDGMLTHGTLLITKKEYLKDEQMWVFHSNEDVLMVHRGSVVAIISNQKELNCLNNMNMGDSRYEN